ncbi:MAG: hypothetical protein RIR34_1389 [Actinomycetota bacterium]
MAIAAIVVSHDDSVAASAVVAAVASQVLQPQITVVSPSIEQAVAELPAEFAADSQNWLWVLTPETTPLPNALSELLKVSEVSPSAALIAPKLVSESNARVLLQYGISVSKMWRPVSRVSQEFDQSQHDDIEDALAAAIPGSLIRFTALQDIGGLNRKLPEPAQTYDLAIRLRLAGGRVLLAPKARIAISGDSKVLLTNQSDLSLRKAQIQLAAGFAPSLVVGFGALFAPLIAILQSAVLLLVKRPEQIASTLAAGFWWIFTIFGKFARRTHLSSQARGGIKGLRVLFASREDVARAQRSKIEEPVAQAERDIEIANDKRPGFAPAGGFWVMAFLAAVSWQFWPRNIAVVGGALLPLNPNLGQLFAHAGSSWQQSGLGLAAPADPFSWVLFALGCVTFWAPTLSVTLFLFLVKPLAFAAAWRALSLVTNKRSLLLLGGLVYAFWPAITQAQFDGRLGTLVALVLMPWFVFTVARVLELGAEARKSVQTWTWVGLSALLAAAISAGAPSLTPLVALAILLLAIYRFKRIGYLIWLPIPLLVLWIPLGVYLIVNLGQPLAVFTDPGIPLDTESQPVWQLLLGSRLDSQFAQYLVYVPAVFIGVGLAAIATRRSLNALALWIALIAAVASAWLLNQVLFQSAGSIFSQAEKPFVAGSGLPLLGLAGLLVAYLLVISAEAKSKFWTLFANGVSWVAAAALVAQFVIMPSALKYTDGTRVPALVAAQAAQNPETRLISISPEPGGQGVQHYSATLVTGTGIHLDDLSIAYRYSVNKLAERPLAKVISQATADLVSANGANVLPVLHKLGVNYVLVPDQSSVAAVNLSASLDTVDQLEAVGSTDYGRLWRVSDQKEVSKTQDSGWSITKGVQVSVLALFALLAVPTRRRARFASDDELTELDTFESEAN